MGRVVPAVAMEDKARRISAPRGVPSALRHRRDSFPGMMAVGGFFLILRPFGRAGVGFAEHW